MMSYINETDFVIENKKLVYPEIVTDGLQLYYDAKGKRDTDYHRDTMLDMSGNKNHGKLHNFAYEKHSGYKDGLVFDYIDDKLVRPALDLKPNDFTFMLNGNIISFSPDGTVKRVQDGEVIESKGVNLVRNGDFRDGTKGWNSYMSNISVDNNGNLKVENNGGASYAQVWRYIDLAPMSKYYFRAKFEIGNRDTKAIPVDWFSGGVKSSEGVYELLKENTSEEIVRRQLKFSNISTQGDYYYISNIQLINLTETFGAGNEPTKEQMDEIINRFVFIPNAQDLIDRIEYKGNDLGDMENIIDGLYKTEVLSSEEIYTDKADDGAVVHVEVDGKSYQQIDSNNLFNPSSSYYTNGINSGLVSWELNLKPNTIYTASTNMPDNNGATKNAFFHIKGSTASSSLNGLSANKPFSLTTNSKGDVEVTTRLSSYAGNIGTIKNRDHWIKVEEGESATPFQGYPSPAPDYPVEIYSLNDFDVVSGKAKENLLSGLGNNIYLDTSFYGNDQNNVEKINVDGKVWLKRLSGGAFRLKQVTLREGATYTYSLNVTSDRQVAISLQQWFLGSYGSKTYILKKGTHRLNHTFIAEGNTDILHTTIPTGVLISDIKLEEGDVGTPYVQALEDLESDTHPLIDKINLLLDEPLRSAGDVKDRLFRDNDGVWKVERKVGEYTTPTDMTNAWWAKGSSSGGWSADKETVPFYSSIMLNRMTNRKQSKNAITNRFIVRDSTRYIVSSNVEEFSMGYTTFGVIIRINKSRLSTEDSTGFKEWLNENPLTIQYELGIPTIEILDQELQDKLNNLRSFSDSNYVYTVDGSTNLLDTVPLLDNHWYPSSGTLQNPVASNGQTATQEPLLVYPSVKIHLTKETVTGDNYWRLVWVGKDNNLVRREVSTVNDLILTAPNGAYGMRVSYPNNSNAVIKFDKSGISQTVSNNLKPTLHAKFLYNNWYKEDRVINNLMIYNRALTNEEMLQNYKTIKRRWGM